MNPLDEYLSELERKYPVQGQTRANIPDRATAVAFMADLDAVRQARGKRYQGGITDASILDAKFRDGFTEFGTFKQGAVNRPALKRADGSYFPLTPAQAPYARLLAREGKTL